MAPNKKKGGRTSSKKKAKGKAGLGRNSSNHVVSQGTSQTTSASLLREISSLPTFHHKSNDRVDHDATGGHYELYKRSTTRFWDWMKRTLPGSKMSAVNDLRKGADMIMEQNIAALDKDPSDPIVVPKEIVDDLSTSIQYRQLLSETRYGEADVGSGHRYMIEVLQHCRSVLRFGRRVANAAIVNSQKGNVDRENANSSENDVIGGRFNALVLDDDEDEEDAEEVNNRIRQRKFPIFEAPQKPEGVDDYDIAEVLINGDDRFQAALLLHTMDDLMGAVDGHYVSLKVSLRSKDRREGDSIKLLMECAVAANMATENIRVAENSLAVNHPHLSSFYHVLALVFLTQCVADMERMIQPTKLKQHPHMALEFAAELVECCFHNCGDKMIPAKVARFTKKSGLKQSQVESEANAIFRLTQFETQLAVEELQNATINRHMLEQGGVTPHSWLKASPFIGGDRCILNTQNMVQKIMDLLKDNTKLVGRPGFWGRSFDEQTQPAERIRGDLDEVFAASIMPELIAICEMAPFRSIPEKSQLITVLNLLHEHMKRGRTDPVPIALIFSLHVLLTSLVILQGHDDLARIATYAKQSYNKLFAQLDELCESQSPQNSPTFYWNVGLFKNLVNFAKPAKAQYDFQAAFLDPAVSERLAFWNPLIGGDYMLYGTYICSIGLGSTTVDSMGQLRFTLHLYNALKQYIPNSNIPLLQGLDMVFGATKAVWVGGRPEKGSYQKHFWLSWGMSVTEAAKEQVGNDCLPTCVQDQRKQSSRLTRKLDAILPEEYSASYRRLVLQDFVDEDGVADYTMMQNATEGSKRRNADLLNLLTRVNMTCDGIDDDEDFVLSTNFSAVGSILLDFTNKLSEHLGWDEILDGAIADYPAEMRTGKTMGGRHMKPGGFNASDLNLRRQGMARLWASLMFRFDSAVEPASDDVIEKVVAFMEDFFTHTPKDRYTFFVEKYKTPQAITRSTPLDGSYPYGRTGKTPQDPLPTFMHNKYGKAGRPKSRFIKPGKYTPCRHGSSGDVVTPYVEQGNKLQRQRSGRYRHIASHGMEELIAMGWDGAMYISKGRHAAGNHYVPFVVGYDSDSDDEYDLIDVRAGKQAGFIGLPKDEIGRYGTVPDLTTPGRMNMVILHDPNR